MVFATAAGWNAEPFIDALIEKTAKIASSELAQRQGIVVNIQSLTNYLLKVRSLLALAEARQADDLFVVHLQRSLMKRLKLVAYEAEDLLDEIDYDMHKIKHHFAGITMMSSVAIYFKNIFTSNAAKEANEIASRLVKLADELEQCIQLLPMDNKKNKWKHSVSPLGEASSYSFVTQLFGRQEDLEKVVNLLTDGVGTSRHSFSVLSLHGIGGVGKTTLAQYVYSDERVQDYFDLKIWVCVSDCIDERRITKEIIESITNNEEKNELSLDILQSVLMVNIASKKILLVLDDMWNEDENKWEKLCAPLRYATSGSKILLTTRLETVVKNVRSRDTIYLKGLERDDFFQLFEKYAFQSSNFEQNPNLEPIGRMIINKLKGLPLAAKTVGSILRSNLSEEHWETIMKSKLWKLPQEEGGILPALRLSYEYLPAHLKQCFSYCSLFPKNYNFEKDELVYMWMAQGFILPRTDLQIEDIGRGYIDDLMSRCFFEKALSSDNYIKMHDLIHDLAELVSDGENLRMDNSILESVARITNFSVNTNHLEPHRLVDICRQHKKLRTLLCSNIQFNVNIHLDNVLTNLRSVRSLTLVRCGIKDLPHNIGNLKHLRYFNISGNDIKRLPKTICRNHNLQYLNILDLQITSIPKEMSNLINLRCLKLERGFIHNIDNIGKMTSLQELVEFIVNRGQGHTILELKNLRQLHRSLHVKGLEVVENKDEACQANLNEKQYLDELLLEWDSNPRKFNNDIDVIEGLQPHDNIKGLSIYYYGGTRSPSWLDQLVWLRINMLNLRGCPNWKEINFVGQLPYLKFLRIDDMNTVKTISFGLHGEFGELELIHLNNMPEWENWIAPEDNRSFPRLKRLIVMDCPKLKVIPLLGINADDMSFLSGDNQKFDGITSLEVLEIKGCPNLKPTIGMASQVPHSDPESLLSQPSSADNDQMISSVSGAEVQSLPAQSLLRSNIPFAAEDPTFDASPKCLSSDIKKSKKLHVDSLDGFVLGRCEVKQRVVKSLLSYDRKKDDVSMILIVAEVGMGKTTLSRLVYNDPLVQRNFDMQGWISASQIDDEAGFLKAVIESITGLSCRLCGLTELKEAVKLKLGSKRFLLVVDETWNDDCMPVHSFLESISFGERGSVILGTSTSQKIINSKWSIEYVNLNDLSYEHCWLIIKSSASLSSGASLSTAVEAVGKRLVYLCKGRPLVARALGGVLSSIEMKSSVENDLLKEDFLLPNKSKNEIFAVLKASYELLPEPLQRCFLYCSMFPEHHSFQKDLIIRLWMSQGFLDSEEGKSEEEIGEEYCYQLLMRSLLQFRRVDDANTEYLEMHDLVRDFSFSISSGQILQIKDTCSCLISDQVRHMSFIPHQSGSPIDFVAVKECRDLQSLLVVERSTIHWAGRRIRILNSKVLEELFANLSCLKALDLSFTNIRELPASIETLKCLSYLGLNATNIRRLPESMCSLPRLQTLELQECACLHELPKGLEQLVNLRHLDVWRTSGYVLIPTGIEHMSSLQSLSAFCVGEDKWHSGIGELRNLVNLRGHLRIGGLRNVVVDSDASKANLQNKYNISILTLQWSSIGREIESNDLKGNVNKVFENLQPHHEIEEIIVRDYPGGYFPSWISDPSFSSLISIVIDTCPYCERLPPLGQLKSLHHLSILRMDGVQHVRNEFRGIAVIAFTALQTLKLHEMYNWELWDGVLKSDFPNLHDLSISRCFKLYNIPNFLSLKKLSITHSTKLSNLHGLPHLKEMSIDHCEKLSCLQELPSLEHLAIHNCPTIQYLQSFPCLEQLRIQNCPNIQNLQDLPHLGELSVQNCAELSSLHGLPSLQDLSIHSSPKLAEFLELTCLRNLSINCSATMFNLGNIPSLQFLKIEGIFNEYLDLDYNLQELQILEVKCNSKLINLMGLMSLKSLNKMKFSHCPELQRPQELPISLHFVEVHSSCFQLNNWIPLGFQKVKANQVEEDGYELFANHGLAAAFLAPKFQEYDDDRMSIHEGTYKFVFEDETPKDRDNSDVMRGKDHVDSPAKMLGVEKLGDQHQGTSKQLLESTGRRLEQLKISKDDNVKEQDHSHHVDYDLIVPLQEDALIEVEALHRKIQQESLNISYLELQQATKNFDISMKIREDGFSIVYKGSFKGTTIAVKTLRQGTHSEQSCFIQEAEVLSSMRHPNIVTLIGFCSQPISLVYEYLPEGNLEDRLTCKGGSPPLSWQVRTRIITEICSALIFLHSNKPYPIVHGDVKPDNIFLGTNLVSKIGDFGISCVLDNQSPNNSFFHVTDHPMGTLGYIDPEYLMTGKLTVQSDVYALGVIILRLLTGKPAFRIVEEVEKVMDKQSRLRSIIDRSARNWPAAQAEELAKLGLKCCNVSPKKRPDLVGEIWKIVDSLLPSTSTTN